MPLDKGSIDLPTTFRDLQCLDHLLLCAKHCPIVDFFDSPLHSCLVNRCINQSWLRSIRRALGASTFSCSLRKPFVAECLQYRGLVRLVFITRNQTRRLMFQDSCRFLHQQFGVLFRAFAVDDRQDKFMFGINRNMIPIVATASVSRITGIAICFLLSDKIPLFVELYLFGLWGKKQPTLHGVARHGVLPISYNGLRYCDQL